MNSITTGVGLALALAMPSALAAGQEIRALFRPDPSQPSKNVFINQTPNSGYCASYPDQCTANSMFSIQLPIRFNGTRALYQGEVIPIKAPANWRRLTVVNADTQEAETVEVRITGVGSKYVLSQPAYELVGVSDVLEGHQKLWTNSSWVYAPAPCLFSGNAPYGPEHYRFFWKTPVEAFCTKRNAYPIPSIYFDTLDFAYELRTPNPLGMSSGIYTGSLTYRLGSGADFDFGPLMQPDDDSLTLDFVLDVQHTLKVDLPPGGNKVSLEPEGGWAPWLDSGRKPRRIFRDQPFYLSASSRFKVMMLCNSMGGPYCSLGSPLGDSVPVKVSMSLPTGITGPGGDVDRIPLHFDNWVGPFQPGIYVDRKPGALHFELEPAAIDFLLRPGKNDRLRGNITIIWDSDV
ncbi:hypothetical protein LIS66_21450 [Pseudomonas sp. HN2]|uniref:hypothetical protein n=1 Tax=Pseudomonas sp. HN2 TaxID=2884805 RepID=UPI001D14F34D|nr:hypothetical protein [Pseudomonas sp. HN2]UEB94914.1 hypothetical protein LIS66_21450 [Pseudomonas sp. HN2]